MDKAIVRRTVAWCASIRRELLEADTRGLAIFRIAFGLAMLVYLVSRVTDDSFLAFHTDLGVLPREHLLRFPFIRHGWSLFFVVGDPPGVAILFGVCAATLLAFTLGYRTRTSAVLSLVVMLSLHHRLPHVVNAAMNISHLLCLYSLALPLGRHYSIDAWLERRRGQSPRPLLDERVRSFGILAFRLQVFYVYFFNVVHKDGETWRQGTAVHYALHDDRITRPWTVFMREHMPRWFSPAATWGTLAVELAIAFCVLSPFVPKHARRFATVAIVALHWAIASVLQLGPFPVMLPSAALLIAASGDFGRLDAWLAPRLEQLGCAVERALGLPPPRERVATLPLPPRLRRLGVASRETYYIAFFVFVATLVRQDSRFFVERLGAYHAPRMVNAVAAALFIPQGWGMFGPNPADHIGVFVVDMEMADGRHVDPLRRAPPDFESFGRRSFDTDYFWQVYQSRLAETAAGSPQQLQLLIDYFCRLPILENWPGTHRIVTVQIFWLTGPTRDPEGHVAEPPRRILLARRGARFTEPLRVEPIRATLPGTSDVRPSQPSPSPRGR